MWASRGLGFITSMTRIPLLGVDEDYVAGAHLARAEPKKVGALDLADAPEKTLMSSKPSLFATAIRSPRAQINLACVRRVLATICSPL